MTKYKVSILRAEKGDQQIEQLEDGKSQWTIAMEFYYGSILIEPDPETNLIRLKCPKDYRCFLEALQTYAKHFGWEE